MIRIPPLGDDDPLMKFATCFDQQIDHGLIVFGSYFRHRFEAPKAVPCPYTIRDIDLIVLRENEVSSHGVIEIDDVRYDVHEYSISHVYDLLNNKRDLIWIRNLFSSALVCHKSEVALHLVSYLSSLKIMKPCDFLHSRNRNDDLLRIRNALHKIRSYPQDSITFSHFYYVIIQTVYYWKCLDLDLWPVAHPGMCQQFWDGQDKSLV